MTTAALNMVIVFHDQYVDVETGSKNRSGGLKELNVDNKVVPIYACPAAGERCLVYLLDLYLPLF